MFHSRRERAASGMRWVSASGRRSHPRPRATTWACYSIAPAARKKQRLPSILWAAKRDLITLRIDEKLGQIRQRADRRTRPCLEFKAITKCSKYQVVIKFNLLVVI
jgi:hypothetical protein